VHVTAADLVFWIAEQIRLAAATVGTVDIDLVSDSLNLKYGWVRPDHHKPTGQPVVVEIAGFDITIATRFGFRGLTGFRSLLLMRSCLTARTTVLVVPPQ
jgi:hypothetical protein